MNVIGVASARFASVVIELCIVPRIVPRIVPSHENGEPISGLAIFVRRGPER